MSRVYLPRGQQTGCSITGCQRRHRAKGFCAAHYGWHNPAARAKQQQYWYTPHGKATRLIAGAIENSKRRGHIAPDLVVDDLLPILERGVCQVSGLPFETRPTGGGSTNPMAPSLDRPDASKPYSRNNFRIVLWAVNVACGSWGLEAALTIWRKVAEVGTNATFAAQTKEKQQVAVIDVTPTHVTTSQDP